MANKRQRIVFPREVLLVEIERHCADAGCGARTRVGLTKEEARLYDGFECGACERWNADGLEERDIPDWWEELTITGLDALRARKLPAATLTQANEDEGGGVVQRLSEAWQQSEEGRRSVKRDRDRDSSNSSSSSAKDARPRDGGDE